MTHRFLTALLLVLVLVAAGRADSPVYDSQGGVAISGYDTVAYFTDGRPVRGRKANAVHWKGVTWRFVSPENRETFEANPRAYAPQYGGYCAYGVSLGQLYRTDPQAWKIVDGKLYLIHNREIFAKWSRDIAGNLKRSDAYWPAVLSK